MQRSCDRLPLDVSLAVRIAFALAVSSPAVASATELALVDGDPNWHDAVAAALEPWGSTVEALDDPERDAVLAPGDRGARLAERSGARVVVWFERADTGSVLWVYDATRGAAVGQELSLAPPFDAATSAAVALSLKTTLRHSAIGPDAPPPPVVTPSVAPVVVPPMERVPAWTLEVALGPRFLATEPDHAEPRLAALLVHRLEALDRHLGVGLRLSGGTGVHLDEPRFDGHWLDATAELVLVLRVSPIEPLELGAWLGAGVAVAHLAGTLDGSQRTVEDWRVNPALSGGVSVGLRLSRVLGLTLRGGADGVLLAQRYVIRGEPLLAVRGVSVFALLGVELAWDG